MAILIGLSSLPFLHELIVNENGLFAWWVPDLNLRELLKDDKGHILGYSSYRVFLYYISSYTAILIALIGWYSVARAKNRFYANAILLCALSVVYHIFLILSNNRKTDYNALDPKLVGTAIIAAILFGIYYYTETQRREK